MATIDDLIEYLDGSRSPWHAAASSAAALIEAGFQPLVLTDDWTELPDAGVVISGAGLVAFRLAPGTGATPFRIIGAHTDSPCLRVKPRPDVGQLGWKQLAVEVYGGVLLNSWVDRDLGVAGRVVLADGSVVDVTVDDAVCRIPQLAIHLDRDVNEKGLVLDKQQHLTPVWGTGSPRAGEFREWLAEQMELTPDEIGWWELCLFDRTPAAVLGADASLLAAGRLDNQLSCWAATDALAHASASETHHQVIALFDHEEVGSESTTGAAGPLLEQVLERISLGRRVSRAGHLAALAGSSCLSADNAHAVHPNYPERHEPGHRPIVNQGPALKVNANQRYATSARTAAAFQAACERAGVPWQVFVSRNNMPCGSTIGPITATRLGIETVDVGVPQLSMHSARELCGTEDPISLAAAAGAWLGDA
ncbi:MAG: M18 family aminopeptidase [Acidimicrobiales bacterium]|nr:M18 family aminopeptidase [Acidimicrobiales bacterium]MCB9395471.1 M18 family aminopeptidase [Acidimicrobiaceae bacterium]